MYKKIAGVRLLYVLSELLIIYLGSLVAGTVNLSNTVHYYFYFPGFLFIIAAYLIHVYREEMVFSEISVPLLLLAGLVSMGFYAHISITNIESASNISNITVVAGVAWVLIGMHSFHRNIMHDLTVYGRYKKKASKKGVSFSDKSYLGILLRSNILGSLIQATSSVLWLTIGAVLIIGVL